MRMVERIGQWQAVPLAGKVETTCFVILFINPRSGDRKGRKLVDLPFQFWNLKNAPHAQISVYNIADTKSLSEGITYIRNLQATYIDPRYEIQVWSGGGDGTVMWMFDSIIASQVDLQRLRFCHIPLGTGNDFSQALGWQRTIGRPLEKRVSMNEFCAYCEERVRGTPVHLDVWTITVEAYADGYVQKVTKAKRKHKERAHLKPSHHGSVSATTSTPGSSMTSLAAPMSDTSGTRSPSGSVSSGASGSGDAAVPPPPSPLAIPLFDMDPEPMSGGYFASPDADRSRDRNRDLATSPKSDTETESRSRARKGLSPMALKEQSRSVSPARSASSSLTSEEGDVMTGEEEADADGDAAPSEVASGVQVRRFTRTFSSYFTLGLQGLVGTSFEQRRTNSRLGNLTRYAAESSKVLASGVPPVTRVLDSIEQDGKPILVADPPKDTPAVLQTPIAAAPVELFKSVTSLLRTSTRSSTASTSSSGSTSNSWAGSGFGFGLGSGRPAKSPPLPGKASGSSVESIALDGASTPRPTPRLTAPRLTKHPVEMFFQNIGRVWGRDIDFWNTPMTKDDKTVANRSGATDPANWTPQMANDGKLEVLCIDSLSNYLLEVLDPKSVGRIGQIAGGFKINFRHQADKNMGTTYLMCDGEFYELRRPKSIEVGHGGKAVFLARPDTRMTRDEALFQSGVSLGNDFLFRKKSPSTCSRADARLPTVMHSPREQ